MSTEPSQDQRRYWDDLSSAGPDAVIDPRDSKGFKNRYIKQVRDSHVLSSLGTKHRAILDLGCGTGTMTRVVAPLADVVVGADISHEMLVVARGTGTGSPLVQVPGESLPFASGSFDVALTYVVLGHVVDDRTLGSLLAEIRRVLKPSGRLVSIEQTARRGRSVDSGFKRFRTLGEYRDFFTAAGMQVRRSDRIRGGHFPAIYLVRLGVIPEWLWPSLQRVDQRYARSAASELDYRDTLFDCAVV